MTELAYLILAVIALLVAFSPAWTTALGALFLGVCVPARVALAWAAPYLPPEVYLVPAAGFAYSSVAGGGRGFFGGEAWWASLRPLHSLNYFGAYLLSSAGAKEEARVVLLLDVLLGLAWRRQTHAKSGAACQGAAASCAAN